MADGWESRSAGSGHDAGALVDAAERLVAGARDAIDADTAARILDLLALVEHSTPGGAPLHAQLDTARKWLAATQKAGDHARFGGAEHVRTHLLGQLQLARAAVDDYRRATE